MYKQSEYGLRQSLHRPQSKKIYDRTFFSEIDCLRFQECFNQQAVVEVDGASAGLWLTAGANTVCASDPSTEGEGAEPTAATAEARKLLQDEFLVPPELTANKTSIYLRFVNTPHEVSELWAGRSPLKRHAVWCESDIEVYCFEPSM
jgi:hypothetical protein